MALASFASLLTRISLAVLLAVLVLCLFYHLYHRTSLEVWKSFSRSLVLPSPFLLLVITGSLLVLVMSTWHIIHPDTVEYHAAIIHSIKTKGLVQGYANENIRYGLQSTWFIGCALFSQDLFSMPTLTFANSVVLFWLFLFVADRLSVNYQQSRYLPALLLLLLLCFSLIDFTQVRLTSVSASPDFIATLYLLAAFYFFAHSTALEENRFVILLFGATAMAVKLSSFPIALLLLYLVVASRSWKTFTTAVIVFTLTLLPLVLRNVYTSGYPLFPARFFAIVTPPWKLAESAVLRINQYITAYARTASSTDNAAIQKTLAMQMNEWIPVWWNLRNTGQKLLLLTTAFSLLAGMVHWRKILSVLGQRQILCLFVSLTGLVCWFVLAPDPRFATAWLYTTTAILASVFLGNNSSTVQNKKVVLFPTYLLCLFLFAYLAYRLVYFFDPVNLLLPYGLNGR